TPGAPPFPAQSAPSQNDPARIVASPTLRRPRNHADEPNAMGRSPAAASSATNSGETCENRVIERPAGSPPISATAASANAIAGGIAAASHWSGRSLTPRIVASSAARGHHPSVSVLTLAIGFSGLMLESASLVPRSARMERRRDSGRLPLPISARG